MTETCQTPPLESASRTGVPTAKSPQPIAVQVTGLVKYFPERTGFLRRSGKRSEAVRDVSFNLHRGEIFGLIGPNGAGKTTLIKMLTTLLEPSAGTATVEGLDVVKRQTEVRRLVGLVASNERSFYWRLTGRQNLEFFADLYRLDRQLSHHWITELAEMLGLKDKIHKRFDSYSTGMRQRLALARGLLNRPRILFMDEPTKGVDPIGSADIVRIIKQCIVPQWHPTILITSHNLSEIEKLCDRIAFMHRGQLIACGSLAELRDAAVPGERYALKILGPSAAALTAMAHAAGGSDVRAANDEDAVDLHVEFKIGHDGFAHLTRDIIVAGGSITHCTAHRATIDEVFDKLVTAHSEVLPKAGVS